MNRTALTVLAAALGAWTVAMPASAQIVCTPAGEASVPSVLTGEPRSSIALITAEDIRQAGAENFEDILRGRVQGLSVREDSDPPRRPSTLELLAGSYPCPPSTEADPLLDAFFTPELVMEHQQRIGLTAEQRARIVAAIQDAQPAFVEAQWSLESEKLALDSIVRDTHIDETRVTAQLDRVLELERTIKRSRVLMLTRIKNVLTEEQQTELKRLRSTRGLSSSYFYWGPWQDRPEPGTLVHWWGPWQR